MKNTKLINKNIYLKLVTSVSVIINLTYQALISSGNVHYAVALKVMTMSFENFFNIYIHSSSLTVAEASVTLSA